MSYGRSVLNAICNEKQVSDIIINNVRNRMLSFKDFDDTIALNWRLNDINV